MTSIVSAPADLVVATSDDIQVRFAGIDLGTEYRSVAGRIGGDGTEWKGSWTYLPQPPEAARTLRLEFTLDGEPTGKDCEIRIR